MGANGRDGSSVDALQRALKLAAAAERLDDHRLAERYSRDAIALDPESYAAWTYLARSVSSLERYDEANAAARIAIGLAPDAVHAWTALAINLNNQRCATGKGEAELRAALGVLLALEPDGAIGLELQAELHQKAGELEDAIRLYERLIGRNPHDSGYWVGLTYCLSELKRFEEMVAAGRRAIALFPNEAFVANNLGVALRESGRYAEALEFFVLALRNDPTHVESKQSLLHLAYSLPVRIQRELFGVDAEPTRPLARAIRFLITRRVARERSEDLAAAVLASPETQELLRTLYEESMRRPP